MKNNKLNSKQTYQEVVNLGGTHFNQIFDDNAVSKIDAKNMGLPLYDGAVCKVCKTTVRINIDSEHWSAKGHHDGECYCCYNVGAITRKTAVKDYLKKYPQEKIDLVELVKERDAKTTSTGIQHHIHHIIPVSLRHNYANAEHNESCNNKIVLNEDDHYEIHRLINKNIDPYTALYQVRPDTTGTLVSFYPTPVPSVTKNPTPFEMHFD